MLVIDKLKQIASLPGHNSDLALAAVIAEHKLEATFSATDPLVILNYSQIESKRSDPIAQECRGLTLDTRNFDIVARSFKRFFNTSEEVPGQPDFDWNMHYCISKEDGSLVSVYRYNGTIRVNTRGSFGQGKPHPNHPASWTEMVWSCLDKMTMDDIVNEGETWVFEFCSPYNKVVRSYPKPVVYLLDMVYNDTGEGQDQEYLDSTGREYGIQRPLWWVKNSQDDLPSLLEYAAAGDPTFEGFVLLDKNGNRKKIKRLSYLELHRQANGGILTYTRMLEIIEEGEHYEFISYMPEWKWMCDEILNETALVKQKCQDLWESYKHLTDQKEFALAVSHLPYRAVLFNTKRDGDFEKAWNDAGKKYMRKYFDSKTIPVLQGDGQ